MSSNNDNSNNNNSNSNNTNNAILGEDVAARPYDRVAAAGRPATPLEFPQLNFRRGRRDNVVVYDGETGQHTRATNVLFRTFQDAYWPIENKRMKTIMGHVEICWVLRREARDDDSSDEESDDEIVFTKTKECVAVKVNYGHKMNELIGVHAENPLKEISAMELIGNENPHVMGIVDYIIVGDDLNVVMPYADSGDMFDMMQHRNGLRLPEGEALYWFKQLINGIEHMHRKGICHRDISLENLMINRGYLVIIDMGMAIRIPYTDPNKKGDPCAVTDILHGTEKRLIKPQGTCGKFSYMSPEIYANRDPFEGAAVDIWTAGTILFCLITGNKCYDQPSRTDPSFWWITHNLPQLLDDWGIDDLSQECIDLLGNMLQVDPRLRLTLEEIQNHPWMAHSETVPAALG